MSYSKDFTPSSFQEHQYSASSESLSHPQNEINNYQNQHSFSNIPSCDLSYSSKSQESSYQRGFTSQDHAVNFRQRFAPFPRCPPPISFAVPPPPLPSMRFNVPPPVPHFLNPPRSNFFEGSFSRSQIDCDNSIFQGSSFPSHFGKVADCDFSTFGSQGRASFIPDSKFQSDEISKKLSNWYGSVRDRLVSECKLNESEDTGDEIIQFKCRNSNDNSSQDDAQHSKELMSWFESVQARQKSELNVKKPKIKIIDVQHAAFECGVAICDLEDIVNCVPSNNVENREKWIIWKTETKNLMSQIKIAFDFFKQSNNTIKDIQFAIEQRRQKRKRARISKKKRILARQKCKKIQKEVEKNIDQNIKILRQQYLDEIREDKLKKEADFVLKEVRSKQEDITEMRKFLTVLSTLREVRMKKGDIHGYVPDTMANEIFERLKETFFDLLSDQMNHYKQEEDTLKVMMMKSKKHSIIPTNNSGDDIQKMTQYIYHALFGKEKECLSPEIHHLFTSDPSLDLLIKRRNDWDVFLNNDGQESQSEYGGRIPLGWIFNDKPNSQWKAYLTED